MKATLFVAVALTAASITSAPLSAPAWAQDDAYGFGYDPVNNANMLSGAIGYAQAKQKVRQLEGSGSSSLSSSMRRSVRRSNRPLGSSASAGALTFKPSASVRRRVLDGYVAAIRKNSPKEAAKLQKVFASQDIFALLGRSMAPYGLKTNNLADAMTIYTLTAWQGARGSNGELPRAQVRAVRGQMARAFSTTPSLAKASGAQKQELSDSLLVQALLFDAFINAAKKQPSAMPQTKAIIAQNVRATFGLDLNALKLTNQGLRA